MTVGCLHCRLVLPPHHLEHRLVVGIVILKPLEVHHQLVLLLAVRVSEGPLSREREQRVGAESGSLGAPTLPCHLHDALVVHLVKVPLLAELVPGGLCLVRDLLHLVDGDLHVLQLVGCAQQHSGSVIAKRTPRYEPQWAWAWRGAGRLGWGGVGWGAWRPRRRASWAASLTELLVAKVDVGDRAHVHLRELALALQPIPLALEHIECLVLRSTHANTHIGETWSSLPALPGFSHHAHLQQHVPDEVVKHLWAAGDGRSWHSLHLH